MFSSLATYLGYISLCTIEILSTCTNLFHVGRLPVQLPELDSPLRNSHISVEAGSVKLHIEWELFCTGAPQCL